MNYAYMDSGTGVQGNGGTNASGDSYCRYAISAAALKDSVRKRIGRTNTGSLVLSLSITRQEYERGSKSFA